MTSIRIVISKRHLFDSAIRGLVVVAGLLLCGCADQSREELKPDPLATAGWPQFESEQAQEFIAICRADFQLAYQHFQTLEQLGEDYPGRQLLKDINQLDIILDRASSKSSLYRNVHPDASVREAADLCQQKFADLESAINLSRPLYTQLVDVETEDLSSIDKRYVNKMLNNFRRSGVNKDADTRARIRRLNEEINLLGQDFNRNVRRDVRTLVVESVDRLAGLPQDYLDAHHPNADGAIAITTNYPDVVPIMKYAHDDSLRLDMYKIFRQRAYPENRDILKELLKKRYELAQLLDYGNFAQYVTEDKMIGTPENAQAFIDKVAAIADPRADAEYQMLLARLQKIDSGAAEVGDWQKEYLEELVKKERYQVDAQEIRQYFRYTNVREGIFALAETLFGIEIVPWETDTWHESVESYEILEEGVVIGRFHLDMHPREGKYNHAAAFGIQEGVQGMQVPVSALVCNFPGGDGGPGYMEHSQVETFLHEFGHLLHGIFGGQQPWLRLSGIRTEWDFVEAPSQMLEEWVWDAETLKTFARNSSGEIIPEDLVERMNASRNFGRGLWTQHQMFYAALSLNYYNRPPETFVLDTLMQDMQERYSPYNFVEDTYFYTSFGHLYGYSAIYYTYMWSLVIASDMFSEFKALGLRNPAVAQRYRAAVLAPGGSKDAAKLVTDFLQRPYNFDAFADELNEKSL